MFIPLQYNELKIIEFQLHDVIYNRYNLLNKGKKLNIAPVDIIPATFYTLTLQRNGDKMVKLYIMLYLNIIINIL